MNPQNKSFFWKSRAKKFLDPPNFSKKNHGPPNVTRPPWFLIYDRSLRLTYFISIVYLLRIHMGDWVFSESTLIHRIDSVFSFWLENFPFIGSTTILLKTVILPVERRKRSSRRSRSSSWMPFYRQEQLLVFPRIKSWVCASIAWHRKAW